MMKAIVVGNVRIRHKNFATFLDRTTMFSESYFCANTHELVDLLNRRQVDVIFSQDTTLGFSTKELFKAVRKKEEWSDIPIFLFSREVAPEQRIRALDMGAADFFSDRTPVTEINALTQFHVTKKNRIEKLRRKQETLFKVDKLTGLHTWEHLQARVEEREKAEVATPNQYAVLALRPDHIESIGETLGPQFVEKALTALSGALQKICRRGDVLCRLDEHVFGLLMHHINEHQAFAAAERIRKKIAGLPMDYPLTVSIGVTCRKGKSRNDAVMTINDAYLALKAASIKGVNRSELGRKQPTPRQQVPQHDSFPVPPSNETVYAAWQQQWMSGS